MHFVANYEIGSDVSVIADDLVLMINHPGGVFKAQIKNIPRADFTTPFLLSLHIYFEAPDLEEAKETAEDLMASCLNMLAFTTGAGFRKHRIRQIVDADTSSTKAVRDVLMWAEKVKYEDPQPFLDNANATSIERLLAHDIPPAIQRALRWYRLGIDASSPDDQFTYFWFSLEIVAEFQKPTEKVHDKCPHCQEPLYCENCETHPTHRPYAKQAIRALMKAADQECDDATVSLLDRTRNRLMHGATLREIENSLPNPHEHVVDILGRILWRALVMQFPEDLFDGTVVMGVPSTYVHYKANAVAHVQTVVPIDSEGRFDLSFKGVTVEAKPLGPPQSAAPSVIRMTHEQYDRLRKLSYQESEHQAILERVRSHIQEQDDHILALVLATDMFLIRRAVEMKQEGAWQSLFREILEPTGGDDA